MGIRAMNLAFLEHGAGRRAAICSVLHHAPGTRHMRRRATTSMNKNLSPWILGARSETGYVRSSNEDRMGWIRTTYGDAFIVSDGMGGYRGGALAAELTVRTLQEHLALITPQCPNFADGIRQAFVSANREVFNQRRLKDPETCDMGATGVALVTCGSRAMVAHVGDSRAYLWRRTAGLRLLTNDHTCVQSMLDAGLLTPAQAAVHPDVGVLDRAIGHQPMVQVDVSDWIDVQRGDMLLLCSDGLSGYVSDLEIETILRADGDVQNTTDRLIECALSKGGADNVTVQLVRFAPRREISFMRLAKSPVVLVLAFVGLCAIAMSLMYAQLTASQQQEAALRQAQLAQLQREVASLKADLVASKVATPSPSARTPSSVVEAAVPAVSAPPSSVAKAPPTSRSGAKARQEKRPSLKLPNAKQTRSDNPIGHPSAGTVATPPATTGETRPNDEKEGTPPASTGGATSAPNVPGATGASSVPSAPGASGSQ